MNYAEKILNHANKLNELHNIASDAVRKGVLSSFTVNDMDHSDMIGKGLYLGLNMTYHAIELEINNIKSMMENGDEEMKELTVEMIKELLDKGFDVEIECIDRDGFLDDHSANKEILSVGELIVEMVIDEDIKIKKAVPRITPRELRYFRIKKQENEKKEPSATFDELIGVAVQAYKDGVISNILLIEGDLTVSFNNDGIGLTGFGISNKKDESYDYSEYINDIKSLYSETFTIESEDDLDNIKWHEAKAVLLNGEEIDPSLILNSKLCVNSFKILKGATITQKKGGK